MTLRLLVVDDHPVVRMGLVAMLSEHTDFEVVGEAADGAEGVLLA
jgi:DNA-binding NarL/FixJ family response regulator